jgi:CIC family chloride channel protein
LSPSLQRSSAARHVTLLAWALGIGLVATAPALAFRWAATALPGLVWPDGGNLVHGVSVAAPALRLLVPTVGLFLAGLVVAVGERWSGRGRGWDILEAVQLRDGVLPLRPTLVKSLSSLVTVAAAGPVGREGAIVLLPAAVSSAVGRLAGEAPRRLRILVGCGAAAGLACAYNAPIASALFTMEIIFGSFELGVFAPLVVASSAATLLARRLFESTPLFTVPPLALQGTWELLGVAVLGLLGGLVASAFLAALRGSSALFKRLALPRPVSMALMGAVVGVVILRYPEIVGNGREAIAGLFQGPVALERALALVVLRLAVTPLTVGAGTVGGVFTPTLFLGAMLGDAFGAALSALFPHLAVEPRAYALVGMGAVLAGTTHAPLTAVLMVFEMTLDYAVVVPLLLGAAISALVARGLSAESVYTETLHRKAGETRAVTLAAAAARVGDLMRADPLVVAPDLALPQVLERLTDARRNHAYVVDGEGRYLGAVNLHDATRALGETSAPGRLTASDLANAHFRAAAKEDPLERVLDLFGRQECERLPVLADRTSRRLVGTISKRDILALYSKELLRRADEQVP